MIPSEKGKKRPLPPLHSGASRVSRLSLQGYPKFKKAFGRESIARSELLCVSADTWAGSSELSRLEGEAPPHGPRGRKLRIP